MSINISDMLPNGISSGRTINIDIDTENIFEISNNEKLNDGAGTLSDGTDAIIDGVGELSDGAHKLADGITEFSEDGIDEIINSYNGDIEPLVDRIQAVLDAGADYQTYTDIADGVNGSVKFIIKTDAVKAED